MGKMLCLLRSVNVGGKNIIKMADLKVCFEKMGFRDVKTYIQSGNILFSSDKAISALTGMVEKFLFDRLGYKEPVLVMSDKKLDSIVSSSPKGFGEKPDTLKYDVIYIVKGITAKSFAKAVSLKEGIDTMHVGKDALYFSRLISKASESHLSRITARPEYKLVTVRNWNTTVKLRDLMFSE